jgi:hypothetical protein
MARDFLARQGLKSAGILCVFQTFRTDGLAKKIRQPPQGISSEVPCTKTNVCIVAAAVL